MIWNDAAETMPVAERRALQLARLRETLRWTRERVAVMRERIGEPNLDALEDLPRVPFTRKSDLREHYPFGLFAVPREELVRIHASSGT
jgi:phenylacetate-CoA ligase